MYDMRPIILLGQHDDHYNKGIILPVIYAFLREAGSTELLGISTADTVFLGSRL